LNGSFFADEKRERHQALSTKNEKKEKKYFNKPYKIHSHEGLRPYDREKKGKAKWANGLQNWRKSV